uniref:Putative olee1-like protein n=1 Tax=Davidia involucrata TaxID=16924 RepID=A0A5B7B8H0_DAVIN
MAKSFQAVTLFACSALCLFSLLGVAHCGDSHFFVEGEVYCDTCRSQFITRVSEKMSGAKVRLECRGLEGGELSYSIEGETDENGYYRLPVEGEHEEEICEVSLVKSSKPDCEEISTEGWAKSSSRISLTSNNGIASDKRLANPLGFMAKEALPECAEVFKEMGMLPAAAL